MCCPMHELDTGLSLPDHAAKHWFRAPYELQHRLKSECRPLHVNNSVHKSSSVKPPGMPAGCLLLSLKPSTYLECTIQIWNTVRCISLLSAAGSGCGNPFIFGGSAWVACSTFWAGISASNAGAYRTCTSPSGIRGPRDAQQHLPRRPGATSLSVKRTMCAGKVANTLHADSKSS